MQFVGRADGDLKSYLLQNAMAVAMPSRGWEAFPLVVLEAFAAGRPVLGSDIPGLADVVVDGTTGLLVDAESIADWAAALRRVREDVPWRTAAGVAARAAVDGFDWDTITRRHVALYERLIAEKGTPDVQPGLR